MRQQGIEAAKADVSLRPVLMLVGLALLVRIVYLVWICGYDLVEDEAQYWLWSQHLDWSYYSKGPGVAWAIWLSTKVFGNAEWAVRLPSVLASAIGALAVGGLARDLAARAWDAASVEQRTEWATPSRVGLAAALAYTLVPVLQGAGIVMTIDAPYVACWAVACWAFWRACYASSPTVREGLGSAGTPKPSLTVGLLVLTVGGAIAIGFLFKYTMLLLVPGLIGFAIVRRREIVLARAWIALAVAIVLTGLVPVVYWNAKNGWPTVAHLLGHLGMKGGDMPVATASGETKWSPWWLPSLIGQQLAIVGPWLVLALVARRSAADDSSKNDSRREGQVFLIWAATPILVFYTIVALIAEPEGNWPMAAYATLMPLVAWMGADALAARAAARRTGRAVAGRVQRRVYLWRAGLWYAIIAAIPIHCLDRIGDAAIALDQQAWFHDAFVKMTGREPRDPAGRVRGAKDMAEHVLELLQYQLTRTGQYPFVIAQHYGRASQLSYYLRPELRPDSAWVEPTADSLAVHRNLYMPPVLCAMNQTGGRKSQFDYWPHTDLWQASLMGRPAVIVSSTQPYLQNIWLTMFARVEPIPGQRLRGEGKPDRSAYLGYEYRGPPSEARPKPEHGGSP